MRAPPGHRGFSQINDAFGYATGDQVLQSIGRRLTELAQSPDHVARLGNDEFVLVIEGVTDREHAMRRCDQVLEFVNTPVTINGVEVDIRCCVGISLSPNHGDDATALLQRADVALYAAKRCHAPIKVWDPAHEGDSGRRLALVADLRHALAEHHLDVHF